MAGHCHVSGFYYHYCTCAATGFNQINKLVFSVGRKNRLDLLNVTMPEPSDLCSRFTLEDKESAIERNNLMRLAWDWVSTEFSSRHTQYEMFYNGAPHVALNRMWHFFRWQDVDAQVDRALKSLGNFDDLVGSRKPGSVGGGRRVALTASA